MKCYKLFLMGALAASQSLAAVEDPAWTNCYKDVAGLGIPVKQHEKVFAPKDRQANFTFSNGASNVRVEEGILKFTLAAKVATLGWGNYMGRQPVADIVDLWEEQNTIVLKIKQSGASSAWQARWWVDGSRIKADPATNNLISFPGLSGIAWTNLTFVPPSVQVPTPDGFELQISGAPGDQFEIETVTLVQNRCEGYARKEFVLPEGKIWRAVAQVGAQPEYRWCGVNKIIDRLYINGKEVKRRGTRWLYGAAPVDIAPYLKPGANCAAFYAYRAGVPGYSPFPMLYADVQMASGQRVSVQTDTTWKYSPKEEAGWNQAGFNDAPWTLIKDLWSYMSAPRVNTQELCVVKNPGHKDFFYADDQDMAFEVRIPAGLKSQAPALTYAFFKADAEGQLTPVTESKAPAFTEKDDSLVATFQVGRQPRGVYAFTVKIEGQGGLIESRPPEPVMVIRKVPFKTIAGNDWFEGLDVELEDTIDFTNPKDPHPWIEAKPGGKESVTQPAVVTKDGLTYRETIGYYFSYRIGEFKQPGSFYLLELEYPDNEDREFDVSISTKYEEMWSNSQSGVGAHTGGRLYKTGKMQTLRWIHVADPGVHSVDIINIGARQRPDTKAAAKTLKIYRIKGDLPAVANGTDRLFGIHTERCYNTSGIGMNFGIGQHKTRKDIEAEAKAYTPTQRSLRYLQFLQDTTERYTQYLKFTGQNTHIMGCFQYNEDNTPFEHPYEFETARIIPSMKSVLANTLEINDLSFFTGFEWSQFYHVSLNTFANNAQVAKGADTCWMVKADGQQYYGIGLSTVVPNWMHPEVRRLFQEQTTEFVEKFGHLKNYKGVWFPLGLAQGVGYWVPAFVMGNTYQNPLDYSYDDQTFRQFEQETGTKLPITPTDPQRFEKRASLLQNETLRKQFIDWRCKKLQEFLVAGLQSLRGRRADLRWLNAMWISEPSFFKYWFNSGRDYKDLLKDYGVDLDLLNRTDGMCVGRWAVSWRSAGTVPPTQDPYLWLPRVDPRITSAYDNPVSRYVHIRSSWEEGAFAAPGHTYKNPGTLVESDWIMDGTQTRTLPQPGGLHCREAFIQAVITADPTMLASGLTDLNINVGNEQEIREIMKIVTRLPANRFSAVLNTGLDTNLAIRQLVKDGQTWIYIANPGYWTVKGAVTISGAKEILDLMTGQPVKTETQNGKLILPVTLKPYGLAAFKVAGEQSSGEKSKIENRQSKITIESFTTEPITKQELAHMEGIMARVQSLATDPEIKLALAPADRDLTLDTLKQVRESLNAGAYAKAWAQLTGTAFWSLWKDFLEKASKGLAFILPGIEKEPLKKNDAGQRVLTALKTSETPKLDGNLDDPAWQKVKFQTWFVDREKRPGMAETGVKALYDDQALYLGLICADKDIKALKASEAFSWSDDTLAIFIQPDEKLPVYYQLGFNTKGLQMHQKVTGGERNYTPLPGWKPAVAAADKVWTAEVLLPYETFGLKDKGTTAWRINVHRPYRNGIIPSSSWAWTGDSFHNIDKCGRLEFSEK